MPNLTSSFASAAAGATSDRNATNTNEWSRPRVNGTTFRRSSNQSRDNLAAVSASTPNATTGVYIPPHLNVTNPQTMASRNGTGTIPEARYSRDEMLSIYELQRQSGQLDSQLTSIFAGPWDPNASPDSREAREPGAEVCWNSDPVYDPLGMTEMDDDERTLFTSSVNSPLKMNNPKDQQGTTAGGRKASLSTVNTSSTSRPGTRRRDTSDSFAGNGPLSPSIEKTFRNDANANTPPALLRRRTDLQDDEKDDTQQSRQNDSPFGSVRRSGTGGPLSAGINPPSASPWSSGGAFGAFGSAIDPQADPNSAQRPGFGSTRSTSRFKDILGKTAEDMSPSVKEKQSFGALEKLPEEDDSSARAREPLKTRPNRSETNPYDDALPRTGSAALSAQEEQGIEQMGFSAFNGTPQAHRFNNHDPTSPTNTNPYQSPAGDRLPEDDHSSQHGNQPFARRDVFSGADHRQQGSFGSMRGPSSSLSGFGGFAGWDNPGFGTGTPGRERPPVSMASAFGDPVFSPLGGLQSPGGFGANGSLFAGGSAFGRGAGQRGLGLPFPPAMQDQMRSDSRNDAFAARADPFDTRRPDNFRGAFDDMRPGSGDDNFSSFPQNRSPVGTTTRRSGSNSPEGDSDHSQIPQTQQRQMVMPDRMLWVYRDPAGNDQGPFTGLEMHDWFKAGFFTAELQIKKLEDREFEPLAQLIRRIGNSREPFLVPQIGIPHGPAGATNPPQSALFSPPSAAQPPFASSFPNFGTTLTADQQNALERRKQEEQTLMAQQKEWLAQNKLGIGRPSSMQFSGHPQTLTHQPSGQSLHSQPSFGSITSPTAYQPQAPIQPPGNAFSGMSPTSAGPQREDSLAGQLGRMGLENRGPYNANSINQHSFANHERNRLSMEQQLAHEATFLGQEGHNERLEEFHELRQDMDEDESEDESDLPRPIGSQRPQDEALVTHKQPPAPIGSSKKHIDDGELLSLTQQVQRRAAANRQAAVDVDFEFPPTSASPLPAPAARRSGLPVAEQLAAENRSAAQTPVETPGSSIAPWADKTADIPKGPSLKEIQQAEAKRAAEQEAILAEVRRAQLESEQRALAAAAAAAAQAASPAPGLPLSSTWASSGSPITPSTPSGGVWAKPVVAKPTVSTSSKKTLAQIQKEEEARKSKAAAQAALSAQTTVYATSAAPTGNRYAQMASKVSAPPGVPISAANGSAWTTVGSSGKPKTPATIVAAPPPAPQRVASTTGTSLRPTLPASRSTSLSIAAAGPKEKAKEELVKWAKAQLSRGLKKDTNAEDLVNTLMSFPADLELTSDVVYQASDTLDGRRFAEEFIRRRKLADQGKFAEDIKTVASDKAGNGGWSEVAAKKAAPIVVKEEPVAGFKVVAKKKGGKR